MGAKWLTQPCCTGQSTDRVCQGIRPAGWLQRLFLSCCRSMSCPCLFIYLFFVIAFLRNSCRPTVHFSSWQHYEALFWISSVSSGKKLHIYMKPKQETDIALFPFLSEAFRVLFSYIFNFFSEKVKTFPSLGKTSSLSSGAVDLGPPEVCKNRRTGTISCCLFFLRYHKWRKLIWLAAFCLLFSSWENLDKTENWSQTLLGKLWQVQVIL